MTKPSPDNPESRCKPFLVVGATDGQRVVLGEASTERSAKRIAARFRKHCEQYSEVAVEPFVEDERDPYGLVKLLSWWGPMRACMIARMLGISDCRASEALHKAERLGLVVHIAGRTKRGRWAAVGGSGNERST